MRWPYAWIAWETIYHWLKSFGCVEWCCRKRKQLQERSRLGRPVSSDYIKSLWVFQRRACWFCFLFHAMGHILGICGAQSEAPSTSLLVTRRRKRLLKGSRRREILWIWLENQLLRFSPSCREFLPWFAELFSWFSLWFSSLLTKQEEEAAARRKQVLWIAYQTLVSFNSLWYLVIV